MANKESGGEVDESRKARSGKGLVDADGFEMVDHGRNRRTGSGKVVANDWTDARVSRLCYCSQCLQ